MPRDAVVALRDWLLQAGHVDRAQTRGYAMADIAELREHCGCPMPESYVEYCSTMADVARGSFAPFFDATLDPRVVLATVRRDPAAGLGAVALGVTIAVDGRDPEEFALASASGHEAPWVWTSIAGDLSGPLASSFEAYLYYSAARQYGWLVKPRRDWRVGSCEDWWVVERSLRALFPRAWYSEDFTSIFPIADAWLVGWVRRTRFGYSAFGAAAQDAFHTAARGVRVDEFRARDGVR